MVVSLAEDENTVGCKNPQTNKLFHNLIGANHARTISAPLIILSEIFDLCVLRLQKSRQIAFDVC